MPSASLTALPALTADAGGRATGSGDVLFRGTEPTSLETIADGEHIISIGVPGRVLACGVVPVLTSSGVNARLLSEADNRQVIQFNLNAALQKRIFADGFVPNSPEFVVELEGVSYTAQRAEHLASGRVRVYYAAGDAWENIRFAERGTASQAQAEGCPAATGGTQALRNEAHGYCLL
jgi:hypothetical protein